MGSSIKLFSVRGINIYMHVTFPLILVWAAIQFGFLAGGSWAGALFGVIVVILLFVIVTLHELGHSFAALNYGVQVREIVLLPIGGVAQLQRIPENPIQEFVIAIAGPAVNFALAIVMGLVVLLFDIPLINPAEVLTNLRAAGPNAIFSYVFFSNIFIGVFNLLPAFPMDGGRVLRALLATRLSYSQATSIAVAIGKGMAWLLGLYGFLGGGFFLILIAFFIYIGASQEEQLVTMRTILRGLTVNQAYSRQARTLRPDDTLKDAINLTLSTFQASFPVCDNDHLAGLLTYPKLVEALTTYGPDTPVEQVMLRDVESVSPTDELFDVQRRFEEDEVDALPVVQDQHFLGLITSRDVSEVYRLLSIDPNLLRNNGQVKVFTAES
ncbi:MAG: site-2 protease family protein [Chloroflexi bacterium]|nr:site-2 protease family protein [Chloroflexota bacterium]MCI0580760.1 site-2 protease family protein [Chloroflexota bacterium]MCI0644945.1 site-2 protease family protein [Chloroflexota bacterium]MCI0726631.1 site-2 protease family protein [Chloroflexota bacterium]